MSKNLKYCAYGEEGIEFAADTRAECQKWIDDEIAGIGNSDEPMPEDYYGIVTYTQAELDAMPEV